MLRRETSRSQAQVLRQQATLWREPQDDMVQLNSKKVNTQQFRKNNSHLYSNTKHVDKESNPIWDDQGCLLKKAERKQPGILRRSASVASFHKSIYPKQKFDNNTKNSKLQQFEDSSRFDDSESSPSRSRLTRKQQEDSVIRLTKRKNPVREKSVQPRLLSTDFEGFIHRQTNCSKARHQKPAPVPDYKIDISEGTKKLLQRSQKLSSHSIYNLKTKSKREEELEAQNQSESNFSVKPKIRKSEYRLANMNLEKEKELKEDRLALLRVKYDDEEGLNLSEEKRVKPKLNQRSSSRYYQNEEPYIPQKYQPNSVYATRKRIEAKINEMRPILEADQEQITWSIKEKKNRKKTKNKEYLPDYMKTINDVIRPSWEEDHKRAKK